MEIITASYVLPMTNGCPVLKDGAIATELGKIHGAGTLEEMKGRFPDAPVKQHAGLVLMPGLVNAHSHLDLVSLYNPVVFAEGETALDQGLEFAQNLIDAIDFKHDAKPDNIIEGIQRGIDRLIETGTTCVGDMTHFEGTFKLLRDAGLRAVVFPEVLAGRGEAAQQKFEIALALLEKYTDATHDRVRVGLGPYAPYLLSRNLLKIISQHAREASIPLMIHAAESFAEMEFFFDSQGPIATEVFPMLGWAELPPAQRMTPIAYLTEIGFFEAPTTIVGGLQLAAKDFPLLARHLVRVVWCPTMNTLMRHGQFPYGRLSEHGIPTGLGTESWIGQRGFNIWEEMRSATRGGAVPLPSPMEAMRMATIGGARTLGLDHLIGTLEEGKKADYILVHAPEWSPDEGPEAFYQRLVAATEPQHVREVVVASKILKSI
jgi:cytosine/adenosine deaminase-related metal-dependent hydrolase